MPKRISGILALAATVLATTTALSPNVFAADPGAIGVGLFGGYHLVGEDSELGDAWYPDNMAQSGAALGLRGSYSLTSRIDAEVEARMTFSEYKRGATGTSILGLRAALLGHAPFMGPRFVPFVLVGVGTEYIGGKDAPGKDAKDTAVADADSALQLGAGFKFGLSDLLHVRVDFRQTTTAGRTQLWDSNFEFLIGATYVTGGKPADTDKDGISDDNDACPTTPEDRDGFEDLDGCPDLDNDADLVPDKLDKCPDKPETRNGIKDTDGCPDADKDGDGIADLDDQCKEMPEDKDGFEDDDGCPEPDNDKDGVPDTADKCPNKAEDPDNWQDEDGCPDWDNDLDGVKDEDDDCPGAKETFNGYKDGDGCPDKVPSKVAKTFKGTIKGILFELNSAEIKSKSEKVLGKALAVLKKFPSVRFEIAGHTDNTGKPETNLKLSQARADSVKAWFVGKGIDAKRIVAKGYGDAKSVASNRSARGRARNRRIEFVLLNTAPPPPNATP